MKNEKCSSFVVLSGFVFWSAFQYVSHSGFLRDFSSIENFVSLRDRIFKSTVTVTAVACRMCHGGIEWD